MTQNDTQRIKNTQTTQKELENIFRDVFDDETLTIKRDMIAGDIEGWDSLAQIDILTASESEFQIKFTIAEISQLKNIGDIIDLIDSKKGER